MKLYILGNGFDMAHGLNTSYSAFEKYVRTYHKDLYLFLGTMYRNNDPGWLWKDYERNLSNVDIAGMTAKYIRLWKEMERHKLQNFFDTIYDDLQTLFHKWVVSINMTDCTGIMDLNTEDYYISFNYTNVLETIYHIPRSHICYIHNDTKNQEMLRPIIGHGEDNWQIESRIRNHESDIREVVKKEGWPKWCDNENEWVSFLKNRFQELVGSLKKLPNDNIMYNQSFFDRLSRLQIDEVYVIGHSLARVDEPYFKKLLEYEAIKNAVWHISYHSLNEWPKLYYSFIRMTGYRKLPQMFKS